MSEFARYLVAAGVTSARFASIARIAFFKAASLDARFSNQRLNQSAVAAMTGLTRSQVRDFAQLKKLAPRTSRDRIGRIISGWMSDADFTTAGYLPRRLAVGNRNAGFSRLARKYGCDVPARSILRELVRNGLVTVHDGYARLDRKAHQTWGQERLRLVSQMLAELLREPRRPKNSGYPLRSILKEIIYPTASPKGRILMQRRSTEGLRAFLADMQTAGMAVAVEFPPGAKQRTLMTRTRVVVVSEELDSTESIQTQSFTTKEFL